MRPLFKYRYTENNYLVAIIQGHFLRFFFFANFETFFWNIEMISANYLFHRYRRYILAILDLLRGTKTQRVPMIIIITKSLPKKKEK